MAMGKMFSPSGVLHAGLVAHPEMIIVGQRIAQRDVGAEVPEVGEEPVVPGHRRGQPDLGGLVPEAWRIGAEAALALELEGLGVGRPRPDHPLVERPELGVGQAGIEVGRGPALVVENAEPLALERVEALDHANLPDCDAVPLPAEARTAGQPGDGARPASAPSP